MLLLRYPNTSIISTIVLAGVFVIIGTRLLMSTSKEDLASQGSQDQPEEGSAPMKSLAQDEYKGKAEDDPALIAYIGSLLEPPSLKPYQLKDMKRKHFSTSENSELLAEKYIRGKRDGFFVEVGALDGEWFSNTLYLERELGWRGLLIEPNPVSYKQLLSKRRKAYTLNAALSATKEAQELSYVSKNTLGVSGHITSKGSKTIQVKAFPLSSVLMAADISFVDVFSLDIEGFEFKALQTFPWKTVGLGILIMEHMNIPEPLPEVIDYMTKKGYIKIHENKYDYIFASPAYLKQLNETQG